MVLFIVRILFVLAILAIAISMALQPKATSDGLKYPDLPYMIWFISVPAILALAVVLADTIWKRKRLQMLSGVFFGLLAGLLIAYLFSLILEMVARIYPTIDVASPYFELTKMVLGTIAIFTCVSFVIQTKDDFRFVIPYVEFAKQTRGDRPALLDTSVIIDGRITDICKTGFIESQLIVPRFVLSELHTISDSSDKLKRNRGRRGLDVLNALQEMPNLDLQIMDVHVPAVDELHDVDAKLVALGQHLNGKVITNDYNLNKIARIRGVDVLNINDLANAIKPVVLPGETLSVKIIKPGEESGQGVGYLDDGTMVVVEQGREHIGQQINIMVTSALQTSAGRMIFGRAEGGSPQNNNR